MKNLSPILFVLMALTACTTDQKEKTQATDRKAEQDLVGKWTNLSLLVTMKRLEESDSVLQAKEGEWERVLKIKPIETTFLKDSTFASEYYTLEGQKMNTTYGKWWVEKDSLVMLTESGETRYDFELTGNRVRFRATLDWDGDGLADDYYDGVQVRMD
ncbi:hypothetical protein BFP72_17110 [Reichenbachiella sp. 5M10]|uniref:hypothetical protein n=1 Tax=Reichenbachiella sp. 5M10 TaxID=1889772 RepID=UPI000C14507E|nr:hypothetical protein [Reichenbachiella sp. 5M10]PIB36998.1 hypothetical protein BFP72_17110 [Reichenbachiella sp. 5M10]